MSDWIAALLCAQDPELGKDELPGPPGKAMPG